MSFSSEQIIFLINPNSGNEKHENILAELKLADSNVYYHINKRKEDLESFFANLKKQFKVVVVCGGDGTVNSILKHAINTDLVFAVLPTGSGNGFAREMGYAKQIDRLLAQVKKGVAREIDIVKVNDHYCCNIAGIGFDSFIAKQFDQSGKRGLISYVNETLKGFLKFKHFDATINADDICLEGTYFMLTIANTRQFGNNVIIAPMAVPDDGLMNLVAIKRFPKILMPLIVLKLLSKKGRNSKYIQYLSARKIEIKANYKIYHVDGEPIIKKQNTLLSLKVASKINMIQTL